MSDRRILLADDSPTIQKVVNLTFADEGIDVVCASDGDSAFRMVSDFTPDLVLADVNMPGKTGYELCAALRERQETRNTPVILLVGTFEPFDEEKALEVGANDYLTKPFQSIRQLVNTVCELIKKPEPGRPDLEDLPTAPLNGEMRSADDGSVSARADSKPEPDDIESLYRESLHETVELPKDVATKFDDLDDSGFDDELIETEVAESMRHDESVELRSADAEVDSPTEEFQFPEERLDSSDSIRFEDTLRDEHSAATEDRTTETEVGSGRVSAEAPDELSHEEIQTEGTSPYPIEEDARGFEIVSAEAPPAESAPQVEESGLPQFAAEAAFGESDLLDLPSEPRTQAIQSNGSDRVTDQAFSPEMIDRIADRVADRVADALARRLAKLVVPEVLKMIDEEDRQPS